MQTPKKEAVLITNQALRFTLTDFGKVVETYEKQLQKEHLMILENPNIEKWELLHQKTKRNFERFMVVREIKDKYNKMTPFKKMFPFAPRKEYKNMDFLCDILNPILTKEIPSERGTFISLENTKSHLFGLKEKFVGLKRIESLSEESERISKNELKDVFCRFLENFFTRMHVVRCYVEMEDTAEAYIMLRETYTENRYSFIEIKRDNEDFRAAISRAAMYSIQKSMVGGWKGEYKLDVAAISLPKIRSIIGRVTFELGDGGMLESCSLEITEPVEWEDDGEEACRFLNHIGSCIENLNDDETQ
ncbi:MAG: uncharacterized protein A8A55_1928 [Amphiamblys sp. WSBS2006]|nr:MAG: uncharacterized protein A8A55_1928 [Amphiamblys sp. WSBS2006]